MGKWLQIILCNILDNHDWHKYAEPAAKIQSAIKRQCERCGTVRPGFALKNHPRFREAFGIYSIG